MWLDAVAAAAFGGRPDAPPPPNAPRYAAGTRGHVESWFLRANHPSEPRALWLKATLLAPIPGRGGDGGAPLADVWAIAFDGGRTYAARATVPLADAVFGGRDEATAATVAGCRFELGADGAARGQLADSRDGDVTWDLSWRSVGGALGRPLVIFPFDRMLIGGFPRSKLVTPAPALVFGGTLEVFGERWDLAGWRGMQGHNWGREHTAEYAWGQCHFPGDGGAADCVVEGFSARIRLGRRLSPRMSALVVRRGDAEYRFDRTFDFWRQRASIDDLRWTVELSSPDGEARLDLRADAQRMVCLGYRNPDGRLSYCYNSKLAAAELEVRPAVGEPFRCSSAHGGALELLSLERDPRFDRVV